MLITIAVIIDFELVLYTYMFEVHLLLAPIVIWGFNKSMVLSNVPLLLLIYALIDLK